MHISKGVILMGFKEKLGSYYTEAYLKNMEIELLKFKVM